MFQQRFAKNSLIPQLKWALHYKITVYKTTNKFEFTNLMISQSSSTVFLDSSPPSAATPSFGGREIWTGDRLLAASWVLSWKMIGVKNIIRFSHWLRTKLWAGRHFSQDSWVGEHASVYENHLPWGDTTCMGEPQLPQRIVSPWGRWFSHAPACSPTWLSWEKQRTACSLTPNIWDDFFTLLKLVKVYSSSRDESDGFLVSE